MPKSVRARHPDGAAGAPGVAGDAGGGGVGMGGSAARGRQLRAACMSRAAKGMDRRAAVGGSNHRSRPLDTGQLGRLQGHQPDIPARRVLRRIEDLDQAGGGIDRLRRTFQFDLLGSPIDPDRDRPSAGQCQAIAVRPQSAVPGGRSSDSPGYSTRPSRVGRPEARFSGTWRTSSACSEPLCRFGKRRGQPLADAGLDLGRGLDDDLRGPLVGGHSHAGNHAEIVPQGIGRDGGLSLRTRIELYHQPALGRGGLHAA